MDGSFILGIILGVCITLLVYLFIRDFLFKHYLDMISHSVTVHTDINPHSLLSSMKSFKLVLSTTKDSFESVLSSVSCIESEDKNVLEFAKESIGFTESKLNAMIDDLQEVINHGGE